MLRCPSFHHPLKTRSGESVIGVPTMYRWYESQHPPTGEVRIHIKSVVLPTLSSPKIATFALSTHGPPLIFAEHFAAESLAICLLDKNWRDRSIWHYGDTSPASTNAGGRRTSSTRARGMRTVRPDWDIISSSNVLSNSLPRSSRLFSNGPPLRIKDGGVELVDVWQRVENSEATRARDGQQIIFPKRHTVDSRNEMH